MTRRVLPLIVAIIAASLQSTALAQPQDGSRPNVVLIITDDMGWADLSSYGAIDVKTPNIDSLGRDGIRLFEIRTDARTSRPRTPATGCGTEAARAARRVGA